MYLLRRTAARAISSTPSKAFLLKSRSITTYTPAFTARQHQWAPLTFQRRFASDEAIKGETAETVAAQAEEQAQTTPEAPVDENLTPAQEAVISNPEDASATIDADALSTMEKGKAAPARARGVPNTEPNKILYVGNLYYEVKPDQLEGIFSRFGKIESVRLVQDDRGMSRGFGYVEFENVEDAKAAIDNLNLQVFEGRSLVVQFHKEKGRRDATPAAPSKTLFIGNMSFEMSDKDLNDMFKDVQNVVDVRVAIDRRTGAPRGFAHADFVDIASAQKAREQLEGKNFHGRGLRVDFSSSTPGGNRDGQRDGQRSGQRDGRRNYDRNDRGDNRPNRDNRRESAREEF